MEDELASGIERAVFGAVGRDDIDAWLSVGITQGDERRAGGSSIRALNGHRLASTTRAESPSASDAPARRWWEGVAEGAPGPADRLLTRPATTRRFGR